MTQASVTEALLTALDERVAAGSPGAILHVEAPRHGLTFRGASGGFARGALRPLRPEDAFRAASVTKAVTAATALRVASEGLLGLDDPIVAHAPSKVVSLLRGIPGLEVDALTVRLLLGHRSGLPDYFFDEGFQARVRADPQRNWEPLELLEAAALAGAPSFPPGSDFSYGDTGYVLVGLSIEHLLDRPLADAYRDLVLAPLGMDATYLEGREPPRGVDFSHHYDGAQDLRPLNMSFDWAGGGLVTTAADLLRFQWGLFGGALFSEPWLRAMTTFRGDVRWKPDSSARYARYGLGIGTNRVAGEELWGATGVWGAFFYFWPGGPAAIAGTVNQRGLDRTPLLEAVVQALRDGA